MKESKIYFIGGVIASSIIIGAFMLFIPNNIKLGSIGTRDAYTYYHIASSSAGSTFTVSGRAGVILGNVNINTDSSQTISIYDTATSTATTAANTVAAISASTNMREHTFDVVMNRGIEVSVPSGFTGDITLSYK